MFKNKTRPGRWLAGALLAALLSVNSHATGIDFEPIVGTIEGSNTLGFEFDITASGIYQAILTDLESPAPFQFLGLGIVDEASGIILVEEFGTDALSVTFDVDPGRYLALVGGLSDADTNIGTFGLEISDLPIPGAGIFMLSALFGSGFMMRARGA